MRQVLFHNIDPIREPGQANNPSELERGEFAIFNADFSDGNLNLTEAAAGDKFFIAQGVAEGEQPRLSPVIDKSKVEKVVKRTYTAPTVQITDVNPAANLDEGTTFVKFIRVDKGYKPHKRFTAEVHVKAGGDTAANIVDALVEQINANKSSFVTASNVADKLRLTANEVELSFRTAIEGEGETDWVVTAEQTPLRGSGTYAHVSKMENEALGAQSDYYRIWFPQDIPRYADSGTTYDLYTILLRTNTTANISKSNKYAEITIAVAAGVQQNTDNVGTPGVGDTDINLATFFGI